MCRAGGRYSTSDPELDDLAREVWRFRFGCFFLGRAPKRSSGGGMSGTNTAGFSAPISSPDGDEERAGESGPGTSGGFGSSFCCSSRSGSSGSGSMSRSDPLDSESAE